MKTTRKGLLILLVVGLLCVGVPAAAVNAAPIIVNDTLSGALLFPGLPRQNEDGSTTYLGVTYLGTAAGDLPGRWGMVLAVTYPAGSTTGQVMGGAAVGTRVDNVYGIVSGTMDPAAGTFNLVVSALGGSGAYAGMTGAGVFQGTLSNGGETIEGALSLILFPAAAKGRVTSPVQGNENVARALSLLEP